MSTTRAFRRMLPAPVVVAGHGLYRSLTRDIAWRISGQAWTMTRKLAAMKDRHRGERCFLFGNGPSLARTDLSPLAQEWTIGQNRVYLHFPTMGYATRYLVCVNRLVLSQFGAELVKQPCQLFIPWAARADLAAAAHVHYLRTGAPQEAGFVGDATRTLTEGSTVTFVSLQLAYHLGFKEVVLVGVDHRFADKGPAHKAIVSDGPDCNHFHPGYFGAGVRWQLPDLDGSEHAYRLAREAYERDGRRILDATLDGALTVFDKVDLGEIVGVK